MAVDPTTPTSPLAQRIVQRVRRAVGGVPEVIAADLGIAPAYDPEKTTQGDDPAVRRWATANAMQNRLWADEANASRRTRYDQYSEAYDTIAEARRILKVIVGFVFGGDARHGGEENTNPYDLVWKNGAPAQVKEAADAANIRLGLRTKVPQMFASGLQKGDAFGQIVASLTTAMALKPVRARDVDPMVDPFDNLSGWRVTSSSSPGAASMGQAAMVIPPLLMVHYAPDRQWGNRFGESLFHGQVSTFRQFKTGVDILHVLMVMQGARRRTATVEVPRGYTEIQIAKYVQRLRQWNSDTAFMDADGVMHKSVAAILDYADKVWPYRAGSTAPVFHNEQPPPFDKLLEVVKFDHRRMYLGAGVPMALAGALDDAHSRAALSEQGLHLVRVLRFFQQDVVELVIEIIVRCLIIAGLPFEPDWLHVRMPLIGEFNEKLLAEVIDLRAKAAAALNTAGVPMRWILEHVIRIPQEDVEELLADMAAQGEPDLEGDAPPVTPAELLAMHADIREAADRLREAHDTLKPLEGAIGSERLEAILRELHEAPATP